MNSQRLFLFFLLMSVAAGSFAGDIQVSCMPGLSIYLDDQYMGESTAMQDGLFLMNVKKGTRMIRVEKEGFVPRSIQVEVSDLPIEVRIGELIPNPSGRHQKPPTPTAKKEVGYLIVTSAPQNCTVELDGKSENKETPRISFDRIDAGEHTISFSKDGYETITAVIRIPPGVEVTIRGNLFDGKIETIYKGKGSLRVKSSPERCTVRIAGMMREKNQPSLNMTHLPAGEYSIDVSIPGRELSEEILILDRHRTIVEVDFKNRKKPFDVSYVPF
jgi:hypothetical protein